MFGQWLILIEKLEDEIQKDRAMRREHGSSGREIGHEVRKMRSQFHAEVLRFFAHLMLSARIPGVVQEIKDHLALHRSIVISMQFTGESGSPGDGSPHSVLW